MVQWGGGLAAGVGNRAAGSIRPTLQRRRRSMAGRQWQMGNDGSVRARGEAKRRSTRAHICVGVGLQRVARQSNVTVWL